MAGGGDVYISFGGDTAGLESALSVAKAEVQNLQKEMTALGRDMQKTGASADSELGQSLRSVAENLVGAKGHVKDLGGELSNLANKGGEAGGFMSRFTDGIRNGIGGIDEFKAGLTGIIELAAAAFAVEKVEQFVESMTTLGRETAKASMVLGIPTENVAGLGLTAKAAGIDLNSLEMSFTRLSRNVIEQSDGAKRALAALGLSFSDLQGKDANQQLSLLADTFSHIKDGSEKDAIGVALFGRAFDSLLPVLNEGKAGIEELNAIADETNTTLKDKAVEGVHATEIAMIRLGAAVQGDGIAVFKEFKPVIDGVVKVMGDLAIDFSNAAKEGGAVKFAMDALKVSLQFTETGLLAVITFIKEVRSAGVTAFSVVRLEVMELGNVIKDVFFALSDGMTNFFSGFVKAAQAAVTVVGQEYLDLANVIADAVSGHWFAAHDAFVKMGQDAYDAGGKIKDAFSQSLSGFDFSKADADVAASNAAIVARTKSGVNDIVRITKEANDELNTIWGTGGEAVKAKVDQVSAHMAAADHGAAKAAHDAAMASIEALNEELRATEDVANQKRKVIDDALAHNRVTIQEWLSESRTVLYQEADDIRAFYEKELAVAGLTAAEKVRIKSQEADALRKILNQASDDERKAADDVAKHWQQVADKISSDVGGALKGMVTGSETPIHALMNMLNQLASSAIDMVMKWVATHVMGEGIKTASTAAGTAERAASEAAGAAAGKAVTLGSLISSITASASEAFAGVVGFLSPVMGPAAVGPAAATQATVMSVGLSGIYDTGSYSVSHDQIAAVHQGEVIIPSRGGMADEFRNIMDNGGFGGGKSGGDTHLHVHAVDAQSVVSLFKNNGRELAKIVSQHFNDSQSLRPAY